MSLFPCSFACPFLCVGATFTRVIVGVTSGGAACGWLCLLLRRRPRKPHLVGVYSVTWLPVWPAASGGCGGAQLGGASASCWHSLSPEKLRQERPLHPPLPSRELTGAFSLSPTDSLRFALMSRSVLTGHGLLNLWTKLVPPSSPSFLHSHLCSGPCFGLQFLSLPPRSSAQDNTPRILEAQQKLPPPEGQLQ